MSSRARTLLSAGILCHNKHVSKSTPLFIDTAEILLTEQTLAFIYSASAFMVFILFHLPEKLTFQLQLFCFFILFCFSFYFLLEIKKALNAKSNYGLQAHASSHFNLRCKGRRISCFAQTWKSSAEESASLPRDCLLGKLSPPPVLQEPFCAALHRSG